MNEGNYIKILIEDEGKGIPEDDLHRIFDPYFSKKDGGTGLGLTIAYSIIKNHDGYISVKSIVDKGTSINIFLPASKSEAQTLEVEKYNIDKK